MNFITQFFKTTSASTNDLIVLAIVFALFFFYTLYFGKNRIVAIILAFYPAEFFYDHFPFFNGLMRLPASYALLNKVFIFLLFLIPIDIIIGRYIFAESGYGESTHPLRILGNALAGVILVLLFSYTIVSLDSLYNFSPVIDNLFSTQYIFWWRLAPLGLLFVI